MRLKAIIVEDELNLLQMFELFLTEHKNYEVVQTFSNPLDALEQLPHLTFDVAFIDIEMPQMNGVELAKKLLEHNFSTQIVFTTAYVQYALDAIKLGAAEYLVKPISMEAIDEITPKLLLKYKHTNILKTVVHKEATINVHCFGAFMLKNKEGQIVKWPTRKVEELFAYLLVNEDAIVNKWRLAEELWPNKSLHNIYNSVYLLNKTLKEYDIPISVVNINEGYKLEYPTTIQIDYVLFEQLKDKPDNLEEALEIVQLISKNGPLFADKDYIWAFMLQQQLNVKHKKLLFYLIEQFKDDLTLYNQLVADYDRLYG